MDKRELEYWQSVTEHSTYRWTEDSITRLNSGEHLYYIGGEDGHYMRLSQDGKLTVGNYEGAYPHIGEAVIYLRAEISTSILMKRSKQPVSWAELNFWRICFPAILWNKVGQTSQIQTAAWTLK